MSAKQCYDSDGTTFYLGTLLDDKSAHWIIGFTQGMISIHAPLYDQLIMLEFPQDEHWTSKDTTVKNTDVWALRSCEITTSTFSLTISVNELLNSDGDLIPLQDYNGAEMGILKIEGTCGRISLKIPYVVADKLIYFASGSTDLDGAINVSKST